MSTRSNIIAKTKDGYKWIYCHKDGYPEHVGAVLRDCYDPDAVEWLFENGDISSLGLPFQERKWEDDYDAEKCVFYCSRGETGVDARPVTKGYLESLEKSIVEYFYFFDGKDWFGVINTPSDNGGDKKRFEKIGLKVIDIGEIMEISLD